MNGTELMELEGGQKFASLAFFPFGKEVVYGGGAVSLIANIIWLIVSGIPMAVGNAVAGLICCLVKSRGYA